MTTKTKNRFEISTEGMRLLHDGRPLWQLVKELVANCWDEAITFCEVHINTSGRGVIEIIVEDDGNGFRDITDAYTLMSPTPKQSNARVRGRFNIGEKEILAIARDSTIETVGHTVIFPIEGGRKIKRNTRKKGTLITATIKGKQDQIQTTVDMLKSFIPPETMKYIVASNFAEIGSTEISRMRPFALTEATLPTVLSTAINEPIKHTSRKTQIDVYKPKGEKGAIYEMGIFIQYHNMPYDVDINQKVPLPPNRDVVSTAYLQDIYAEVLNVTVDEVNEDNASEPWINLAIEDKQRVKDDVLTKIMECQIGDNAVLENPFDPQANEDAILAGKILIRPQTLSKVVRDRFRDEGGLTTSTESYGGGAIFSFGGGGKTVPEVKITKDMKEVSEYAKWLCDKFFGFSCEVEFVKNASYAPLATYGTQHGSRTLTFNTGNLKKGWFELAPHEKHTELILHELAHENGMGESDLPHAGKYVDQLARLGAKATHLAINGDFDFSLDLK